MHSEGKWIPLRLVECAFLFFRNLVNSKMGVLKKVDERVYFRNRFLLYYFRRRCILFLVERILKILFTKFLNKRKLPTCVYGRFIHCLYF